MPTAIRISSLPARRMALLCCHAFCMLGVALYADAHAADVRIPPDIEARYQRERAACEREKSPEERASCLREAAAARNAAARGELDEAPSNYDKNAVTRCEALPAAERDTCLHRARGEGEMKGSVSGGGILREYREITLPPAGPQQHAPQQEGATPR